MPRYIDADLLKEQMYHEAFEKTTDFQRWDSGCWIRYKMFENVIASIPTADVVEVVRCKECFYAVPYNERWTLPKKNNKFFKIAAGIALITVSVAFLALIIGLIISTFNGGAR